MTTRQQTLEESYFEWLVSQIHPTVGSQRYLGLLDQLNHKEFVFLVPNDDNRIEEGAQLLAEYFTEMGLEAELEHVTGRGCSFLELTIGLSRQLSFMTGRDPISWAWELLGNLGFHSLSDPLSHLNKDYIDETVERVIYRLYHPNGVGGLFPLNHPQEDQRQVELWYQMSAYIEENQ